MLSHPLRDDPRWGDIRGLGYSMNVLMVSLVYVFLLLQARKRPLMYWHCRREGLQTIFLIYICCGCTHLTCTGMGENT